MAGRYFCLGLPQRRHTVGGAGLFAGALADAGGGWLWLFLPEQCEKGHA